MKALETTDPPGSNWGEFGPDDQRGRMNYVTREKVLQGIAEVKEGLTFCLSLPLDYPGGSVLNPRRTPPRIAATLRDARAPASRTSAFRSAEYNPNLTDVVCDDHGAADAAVLDAVGLVRARRQPLRRRRRRQGRDRVLQRLSRRRGRRARAGQATAEALGALRRHARPRRSASRTSPSTARRAAA